MNQAVAVSECSNLDGLRLIGLSRIPRCAACPRFETLRSAFENDALARRPLPSVPSGCVHQVCAPLVGRLAAPAVSGRRRWPSG